MFTYGGKKSISVLWLPRLVGTVNLLMLGCTLCPPSLIVIPWIRTWPITVAGISSEIRVLCLTRFCSPPLPCQPPLTCLCLSERFCPLYNLQQPVLFELAYIKFLTPLATSLINFEWLCFSCDSCALIVLNFSYLCSPLCSTRASQCKLCFSGWDFICKLYLSGWKVPMVLPKKWPIQ